MLPVSDRSDQERRKKKERRKKVTIKKKEARREKEATEKQEENRKPESLSAIVPSVAAPFRGAVLESVAAKLVAAKAKISHPPPFTYMILTY